MSLSGRPLRELRLRDTAPPGPLRRRVIRPPEDGPQCPGRKYGGDDEQRYATGEEPAKRLVIMLRRTRLHAVAVVLAIGDSVPNREHDARGDHARGGQNC